MGYTAYGMWAPLPVELSTSAADTAETADTDVDALVFAMRLRPIETQSTENTVVWMPVAERDAEMCMCFIFFSAVLVSLILCKCFQRPPPIRYTAVTPCEIGARTADPQK